MTDMPTRTIEKINIALLQDLPVQTRITSPKLVQILYTKIRSKNELEKIQPILIGRVNSLVYPLADFEMVLAMRKANIKSIDGIITDYPTMNDMIIAHVKENFSPRSLDPVKIRQLVKYMIENGLDKSKVNKLLWIDTRPELRNAINCIIEDKAIDVLLEMLTEISQKMYFVVTPAYYVIRISKIVSDEQVDAALELQSLTLFKMSSDQKSSWPSHATVDTTLQKFHKIKKLISTENRIRYDKDDIENLGMNVKGEDYYDDDEDDTDTTTKHYDNEKMMKQAAKYIAKDPNLFYVPMEGNQQDLLIHKKTGRVARIQEKDGVLLIFDDLKKSTYLLPEHVCKYMDFDTNNKNIHITKFPTIDKAQKAFDKVKIKNRRCLTITYETLKGR